MPVQALQDLAGVPFGDGRLDTASDQQKDRIIGQVGKSDLHNNCSDSVDRAERTGGKSTVGETPVLIDPTMASITQPKKE